MERTDTYILCEATHLSDFAVSADDVVPEFNLVNPVVGQCRLTPSNPR